MQVIKAQSAGFCMGVSLAVRKLDKAVEARQENASLYTLGPIIHNPTLVNAYELKGAHCLKDHRQAEPGSTVVIRAHGLPREVEDELGARGLKVVDATCPKVKAAQMGIKKSREAGRGTLLLFGEQDHPEVQSLLSYAGGDALVFSSLEELEALPIETDKSYFAAAQTTQDKELFSQAIDWLEEKLSRKLPVLNTICDATRQRQEDLIALTAKVKSMVIVGGMNSGNTRRLAEVARSCGVPAIHVEQVNDLTPEQLAQLAAPGVHTVGLTAGASTPDEHIAAVRDFLESRLFCPQGRLHEK